MLWGARKNIAKQIIKGKADYMLVLKGNHSGMHKELEAWWHKADREELSDVNYAQYTEIDSGHGRIEIRKCEQLLIDSTWLKKEYRWSGLISVIKITADVEEKSTGKQTQEIRWYISSLKLDAQQCLYAVRSHWQVESMHWVLDMTFREDESRIRRGNGALIFNVLRKIAINLFKQDDTKKASLARKKKMAALNDGYRSVLLESGIKMR